MHKRPHKMDEEATKMLRKAGVFRSRFSYMSRRIHPSTNERTNEQCVYLAGVDCEKRREHVFQREQGRCFRCGAYYGLKYGHLHHRRSGSKTERCWCEENLTWACGRCHRMHHAREPLWTKSHPEGLGAL